MTSADTYSVEAKWYWTCVRQIRFAVRRGEGRTAEVADLIDELDTLLQHTRWPALRARVTADIAQLRGLPKPAEASATS